MYRLSTHSLRHYYITKIYKKTLNPVITQKCARHREFKSTSCYINLDPKDAIEALDSTFGDEIKEEAKSKDMEEFVRMFKAWKESGN
jgi:hypothetical protein